MKRFHVHVGVGDLATAVRFYSTLFAAGPTVRKDDYAKWMLDDPRINFAISTWSAEGVDHLGIQVDGADDLAAMETRLRDAGRDLVAETNVDCCYARSDKVWVTDPAGIAWETFHSLGKVPVFQDRDATPEVVADTGCGPDAGKACCR
ncbi:MAG TPA: ArsI/CadI family heavy metal resistance metalloenzyme [Casimicrobiaceae bacterium]|nr:ArsI/CadI family heavy metal resistance metalloenzyme [Casimicrobiaceae bacterium]